MYTNKYCLNRLVERGIQMILGVITVVGFIIIMGIVGMAVMHFIGKALPTHDSEVIDAKPENQF